MHSSLSTKAKIFPLLFKYGLIIADFLYIQYFRTITTSILIYYTFVRSRGVLFFFLIFSFIFLFCKSIIQMNVFWSVFAWRHLSHICVTQGAAMGHEKSGHVYIKDAPFDVPIMNYDVLLSLDTSLSRPNWLILHVPWGGLESHRVDIAGKESTTSLTPLLQIFAKH